MSKTKGFFSHPLLAPVVDTLTGMASLAFMPITSFAGQFKKGYNENQSAEPSERLKDGWARLFDDESGTSVTAGAGAFFGGVGGIVAGGFMVAAAATTTAAIVTGVLAIPALLAVGVVTGPLLMLAPVTVIASALSVGFGGIAGFFKGCGRLLNHALSPKKHGAEKTADVFAEAEGVERDHTAVAFKSKREVFMAEAKKAFHQGTPGADAGYLRHAGRRDHS